MKMKFIGMFLVAMAFTVSASAQEASTEAAPTTPAVEVNAEAAAPEAVNAPVKEAE